MYSASGSCPAGRQEQCMHGIENRNNLVPKPLMDRPRNLVLAFTHITCEYTTTPTKRATSRVRCCFHNSAFHHKPGDAVVHMVYPSLNANKIPGSMFESSSLSHFRDVRPFSTPFKPHRRSNFCADFRERLLQRNRALLTGVHRYSYNKWSIPCCICGTRK